ncbi:hypothetical protein [Paenibacillus oryzisoli]|uniref:hypothetical protein n=1 Tax=Paenibacillus oryzisoli TaxID=1850517 RepID=UPI0012FCFD32|nr:hypothetical protein [Paenibacillus oryzisoli]
MKNFEDKLRKFLIDDIQRRENLKFKWICNYCEVEFLGNENEDKCPDCDSNDIVQKK